jgi:hypothetical protein
MCSILFSTVYGVCSTSLPSQLEKLHSQAEKLLPESLLSQTVLSERLKSRAGKATVSDGIVRKVILTDGITEKNVVSL